MVGTGINNLVIINDQNCLLSVYVLIVHRFFGPSLHLIECRRRIGPNHHSIPMVTLSFVSINFTPLMRCYYTKN